MPRRVRPRGFRYSPSRGPIDARRLLAALLVGGFGIACAVPEAAPAARAVARVRPIEPVSGAMFPASEVDCGARFSFARDPVTGAEAGLAATRSGTTFYAYRPSTSDDENAPLIVVHNGGATSEIMLAGGTGPSTVVWEGRALDAPMLNPGSWTRFAHVLWVDSPTGGYGYARSGRALAGSQAAESAELAEVVISFLECRADRPDRPVVVAAESMGAARAALMLWQIGHPDGGEPSLRYDEGWTADDQTALARLVRVHFARIAVGRGESSSVIDPAVVARQFFGWVLIQPALPSWQAQIAGQYATRVSEQFAADRVPRWRDTRLDLVSRGTVALTDPVESRALLGVELADIPWLAPDAREDAYQLVGAGPSGHYLETRLGPLSEVDGYHAGGLFEVMHRGNANAIFTELLRTTTLLLTDAERDRTVASYAIFELLEQEGLVAAWTIREGWVDVTLADGERIVVRFPRFDARHVVALDRPVERADTIAEWLAQISAQREPRDTSWLGLEFRVRAIARSLSVCVASQARSRTAAAGRGSGTWKLLPEAARIARTCYLARLHRAASVTPSGRSTAMPFPMIVVSPSYFRVERSPARRAATRWRASATILRSDTDEPVQHLAATAATSADADSHLDAAIADVLSALTPPEDWGRDPTVPHLVQRYLQLRDEIYAQLERGAPDAGAYDARELARLRAQVERLTDTQLVELATPTAEQLAQRSDPWVMDILAARKDLCRFIVRRSADVQAGEALMAAALDGED